MSAKPKPTGEWTSQVAYDLYRNNDGGFMAIADAHNAAVASERHSYKQDLVEARKPLLELLQRVNRRLLFGQIKTDVENELAKVGK